MLVKRSSIFLQESPRGIEGSFDVGVAGEGEGQDGVGLGVARRRRLPA